ncbi:AbrB/MazE/SpoVT family DNA-binding domain-containing protein [Bacillus mobilis]|uniref:Transition state regulatory protein AbrB n=1 Tax=Bacillus mobilis TaxID=2026190 RepID=A0A1Y5YTZ6_9BACI|nr:AbrB/MazE/SpoVT family DNA-binding domain-containing protein [Bacillus mobilis]MCU5595068.1 AbrB/MazE/SpoVT family DNA-binding domain-containing protein [Bacillus mobilis]MCU5737663.1 AbrB/MazE/SpoVT family DNA-binding domain-containing protein [Bacillus mobilis]SMD65921.1 Transition state regulatory protein AbrB [Bacillus mobilis]
MKATGIVRKIDNLGRFVLPIEIRRAQGLTDGDLIDISRRGDTVVLRKEKSIGIARKMDHLGRVVIPMELRRLLEIKEGDPVEVFAHKNEIILRKYKVSYACAVTGEINYDNISLAGGKVILSPKALKNIAKEIKQLGLPV